jgi:hypothetical protein
MAAIFIYSECACIENKAIFSLRVKRSQYEWLNFYAHWAGFYSISALKYHNHNNYIIIAVYVDYAHKPYT